MALFPSPYAIVGYEDPFFSGIERAMDRAFSRNVDSAAGGTKGAALTVPNLFRTVAGSSPMDVHENDKEYIITADAPGFEPNEVKIEEVDGVLTLSGEKEVKKEEKDKQGQVLRQERFYKSFTRSFTLPETAQPDKIQAALDKGVLTVTVPKAPAPPKPEPRRIAVGHSGKGPAAVEGSSSPKKSQAAGPLSPKKEAKAAKTQG